MEREQGPGSGAVLGNCKPRSASKQTNPRPASPRRAPGGDAGKVAFVERDEYLVVTRLGVLCYPPRPAPTENAGSYPYQSAIASWGTTPALSRARSPLCRLIIWIPFPGMKECITCSKGCIKYQAREALGGSRKPP